MYIAKLLLVHTKKVQAKCTLSNSYWPIPKGISKMYIAKLLLVHTKRYKQNVHC